MKRVTDLEEILRPEIERLVRWQDEHFPYREGFRVVYDTEPLDFHEEPMIMRFTNFRYEPIRYFQED